jgi:hypothetical protein
MNRGSTPSLPFSDETGTKGKPGKPRARKPRKKEETPKTSDRACPPVPGVVFPQCSLGVGSTKSSDERMLAQSRVASVHRAGWWSSIQTPRDAPL